MLITTHLALNVKEVSFTIEVMTVIKRGEESEFSIARFVQEKGARSSFNKVVDNVQKTLTRQGIVATDPRQKRLMRETLR
jgi:hypothetical protein